jgi:hypothetical protein
VYGDFRGRFAAFTRLRSVLLRGRIRAHVFSGIEFMMFVFIVGPVVRWIIGVTVIAAVLMVAFEVLLIYKLWTATRSFERRMASTVPVQPAGSSAQASAGSSAQASAGSSAGSSAGPSAASAAGSQDAVEQGDVGQGAEAAFGI